MSKETIKTTLLDAHSEFTTKVPVKVEASSQGIAVMPKGYGEFSSADGYGAPIWIEVIGGKLRIYVWSDINNEEPTHIISLEEAQECRRIPD
jgi:hypothetical protein